MRLCSEPRLPAENKVTTSICIGKYKKSIALRINDWKAIRPNKNLPFELYDLSKDIEEVHDVAGQFPDVIKKVTTSIFVYQVQGATSHDARTLIGRHPPIADIHPSY